MRLILRSDYSAELETTFQGKDISQVDECIWKDDGDGLFRFVSARANGDAYTFVFNVEPSRLEAYEYREYFGEGGVRLEKPGEIQDLSTETAHPSVTSTLEPTRQPEPTLTATTQSVQMITPTLQSTPVPEKMGGGPRSGLPCTAMGLAPLAVVGYYLQESGGEINQQSPWRDSVRNPSDPKKIRCLPSRTYGVVLPLVSYFYISLI